MDSYSRPVFLRLTDLDTWVNTSQIVDVAKLQDELWRIKTIRGDITVAGKRDIETLKRFLSSSTTA